jgi:KDO2-lipid IV(A) lauroyltransferase
MKAFVYYTFVLPFIYLLSILPFWILHGIADVFFVLIYYIIGYRKLVVRENLKNSFPEKTEHERLKIERHFFRYLTDFFLETFKTLTISKKNALKRCKFSKQTLRLFEKLNAENRSCIIVMGHYGNWEWAGNTFSILCKQQLYVIYHPLSNKQFDKLMYTMRTRFGSKLYAMKDTIREMIKNRNELNATAFIADQTPSPETAYWTTFLNQPTPVFWGTEKIACKLNYPVVYVTVNRVKRSYYEVNAELLIDHPKDFPEGTISELHTCKLEKDIREQPEIWLWSHKRWKHKNKVPPDFISRQQ